MIHVRSRSTRRYSLAILPVLVAALAAGCGDQKSEDTSTTPPPGGGSPAATTGKAQAGAPATTGNGETLRIPVIPKGTTHEYWKSIHAGALKAQQELEKDGQKVEIIWKGPELENDKNQQINLVQNFIVQKVNGMVLAPLDDSALVRPVEDAGAAKIPVVIIDSGLKTDKYVSFVATDNEKGGELAGEQMGKVLNGKGRVILLRYQVGSSSTDLREQGFLAAIKKFPGVTMLSDNQYAGATVDSALTASQSLLSRYGDQVDGIFCPNESSARGMLKALQQAGKTNVKFVGFDASEDLVAALKSGAMQGLVVQNPFNMGYLAVKTLVDSLKGKTVEKRIDTGVTLVTPENVATKDIQALLNPPLDQYLKQ